ncbi:hypothetical protein Tco_1322739 [Tanacetum coccineum]
MVRACDTDRPCLHLVYEMWDSMVEKVKVEIYKHEGKSPEMSISFYQVVYDILVARWTKSSTPLHCLAHSLNPRFLCDDWLCEGSLLRVPPHKDGEISYERMKCFRRIYPNEDDYDKVLDEFADFSLKAGPFSDVESLFKRGTTNAKRCTNGYLTQSISVDHSRNARSSSETSRSRRRRSMLLKSLKNYALHD